MHLKYVTVSATTYMLKSFITIRHVLYVCGMKTYSRTSMARTGWDHENMFETGVVRANEC